ncbi:MAG: hypothetical protein U1E65_02040 [Myxococcota bacterium]
MLRNCGSPRGLAFLGTLFLATACGGSAGPVHDTIELIGAWANDFGGDENITAAAWNEATIVEADNTNNTAVTQNPASDLFNPNKFNRVVWTEPTAEGFYYCVVDFGKLTAEAARTSTATFDAKSPATGGCGGFSWTHAVPPIEVQGVWSSSFGGMETVTSTSWNGVPIRKFANDKDYAVLQSPADDPYTPNLYSKIVWTELTNGKFWYCTVDFGKSSLLAAETTTKTADPSNPDQSGCGGFSWTRLSH